MMPDDFKALVRTVPDFPRAGIQFRDITTLLADAEGFAGAIDWMAGEAASAQLIAGIEARGFIFGAALARELGLGFVPIRKAGKLPVAAIRQSYALEYGEDSLELDPTLIEKNARVVLVDDLIATGGTARAAASLLRQAGAIVEQALFVIDLPDLGGANLLEIEGIATSALMQFEGD